MNTDEVSAIRRSQSWRNPSAERAEVEAIAKNAAAGPARPQITAVQARILRARRKAELHGSNPAHK